MQSPSDLLAQSYKLESSATVTAASLSNNVSAQAVLSDLMRFATACNTDASFLTKMRMSLSNATPITTRSIIS